MNDSPNVKVWYSLHFDRCHGNKNGHKIGLEIGKWPFWSKFETFDREINIEHKQKKTIVTDDDNCHGTQNI